MHRLMVTLALLLAALWGTPSLAQSRAQLGPLCTSENTPADQQIDACNKIIALKVTRVRAEVVATTKNRQVPWSNSSLLGEVYLAEK